ncbi:unnamed protein product [Toxocara canis]|uniref:7TM_GPCR_Srx domain-containing protein n=1 Tax=Toxocara canis TaxID=6265 RepID=A0A183VD90_TOXCA|nr:unnamed protein product [Toxocara canis]
MISSHDAIMVTDPSRQSDHIHGISDDAIALLASIPLAVVGIIANALAACVARSFHNSFGVLCCGLCITNCAVLLVLVAWMIPAISIAYLWGFDETPCGNFLANFVDFYFSLSVICMTIFVDSITLVRLCVLKQIKQKTSNVATGSNWIGARRKKNPEAVFFLQICLFGIQLEDVSKTSFHCRTDNRVCCSFEWWRGAESSLP